MKQVGNDDLNGGITAKALLGMIGIDEVVESVESRAAISDLTLVKLEPYAPELCKWVRQACERDWLRSFWLLPV